MGAMHSLFAKGVSSSAISGFATNRLLSSSTLSRPIRLAATGIASLAGFVYYVKVWAQDYYFDWSYNDNRDITGRTAVVTGATVDGLGFAAAELLYQLGANVVITVRSKEKGEVALRRLKERTSTSIDENRASYVLCDFLSEASVRNCVLEIKERTSDGIDFLVLNAGISGAKQKDSAGKDAKADNDHSAAKVWMTNHVGPWIFAQELMPSLIQAAKRNPSDDPRVVWVASGAHKKATIDWEDPFHPSRERVGVALSPYSQSKLANIMHAREYQKRVRDLLRQGSKEKTEDENIDVKCISITPGLVWTSMIPKIPLLYPLYWFVCRSPAKGAQVIKMACLDKTLKGGEYLSNCYVKESEGIKGCSNDEALWKQLWELTAKQIEEKMYGGFSETNKKTK